MHRQATSLENSRGRRFAFSTGVPVNSTFVLSRTPVLRCAWRSARPSVPSRLLEQLIGLDRCR
jgi:hypothetical protein